MTVSRNNFINKISYTRAIVALVMFVILGLWLIFEYLDKERNRDLMSWQLRMAVIAEMKSKDIESILEKKKAQLLMLSENASLKLFLTQIIDKGLVEDNVISAQQGHVRNLLISSADRFGFNERRVGHNINKTTNQGLAILDHRMNLIMSTKGFVPAIDELREEVKAVVETGKIKFIDLYSGNSKQPLYGYIAPVFKIQEVDFDLPVGVVLMLLDPRNNVYKALESRHETTKTDESFLVRHSGKTLFYISPLKGGIELFHQLVDENNLLASSYAYLNPGGFSEMKDYRSIDVLITSRKVKNSPWIVVQTISNEEAMDESKKHQRFLLSIFVLILLFLSAAFIAVWKQSVSSRLELISKDLRARTALLDAVTNNMKDNVILLDKK